jgi:hypothetical protein
MRTKPVLMIHEVNKEYLSANINWEDYVLTFDDCLFSQYYYWDFFKDLLTTKILFVPCSLIWFGHQRKRFKKTHIKFPTCEEALKARLSHPYNYMTLAEINILSELSPDLIIGGHGFIHERLTNDDPARRIRMFETDTRLMIEWFQHNFGSRPTYYCYPFNDDNIVAKDAIFKKYNITNVYGKERIDLKDLI